MVEVVVWQGVLDHPARRALPCRVVVRGDDVVSEVDWGEGFRRGTDPSDATTIMQAALRDMAKSTPVAIGSMTVRGPGAVGIDLSGDGR